MKLNNLWNTTTSRPHFEPVTGLPDHSDFVIVGAGGAGLSTAIALTMHGAENITVVDAFMPSWRYARKSLGTGSMLGPWMYGAHTAGLSVGQILKFTKMAKVGLRNTLDYIDRYAENVNNDDWCNLNQYGGFYLAETDYDEEMLDDWKQHLEFNNVNASIMSPDAMWRIAHIETEKPGLLVPNEFILNPAKYYNGLVMGCHKLGVNIIAGFDVEDVYQEGRGWVVSDGLTNKIKANKVIICTGANLEALPPIDALEDCVKRKRILYGATPEVATMRLPPYVVGTADGSFMSRRYDNRIVISYDTNDTYPADLKGPKQSTLRHALRKMREVYPITCDVEKDFEYVWTKNVLTTTDSLPIITDIPELYGLYLNIGYGTNGIVWQQIGAGILRELVLGSKSTPGVELFSLERTSK